MDGRCTLSNSSCKGPLRTIKANVALLVPQPAPNEGKPLRVLLQSSFHNLSFIITSSNRTPALSMPSNSVLALILLSLLFHPTSAATRGPSVGPNNECVRYYASTDCDV
jgi:hypothetical protein